MYIATTPKFTFTLGIDTANIASLFLTFRQDGKNILTLTEDDVIMSGNTVEATLTQAQTLLFHVGKSFAQFRVQLADDTIEVSNPMQIPIDDTFFVEIIE